MAVADLDESEILLLLGWCAHRSRSRRTTREAPDQTRAGLLHAFQKNPRLSISTGGSAGFFAILFIRLSTFLCRS